MKLFLSGVEHEDTLGVRGVRLAFEYQDRSAESLALMKKAAEAGVEVILISGAKYGRPSGDLDEFCEFLEEYSPLFTLVSNLTVAGDAEESSANLLRLRERGFVVVPEFRVGDRLPYLLAMSTEPLVILGGLSDHSGSKKDERRWLAACFRALPGVALHGSGVSRGKPMSRFPWASLDSGDWIGATGWQKVLRSKNRKFVTATKKRVVSDPILASAVLGRTPYQNGRVDKTAAAVRSAESLVEWVEEMNRRRSP